MSSASRTAARAFARLDDSLPLRVLRAGSALRTAVGRSAPDLVALHFALFGLLGGPVYRQAPLVVHFHGPWAHEGVAEGGSARAAAAKLWIEKRAYRPASRFITLSAAFAEVLEREYGVDRALVRVVPGGVDTERFEPSLPRAQARYRAGLPLHRPIILAVRRLARRMGLQDLVTAFAAVRRRVPEALLLVAGSGPLFAALESQIDELGLGDDVRLLGRVPDERLPGLYRAADLSIVPSTALEGFGLTTVESLASGTPVLVAPVGGLLEVVRDLGESLVLPSVGPEAMADRIAAALLGELALPSPEDCVAYARRRFAWPVIARQVRSVYLEAVG
jgi:glycosyltransferase involved in cell wall biosynthesis